MKKILTLLLFASFNLFASLKDLSKELLVDNNAIKMEEFNKRSSELELIKFTGTTDWSLELASVFADSNLVGTTFNTRRTIVRDDSVTLSSAFGYGMNFSFGLESSFYDFSKGGSPFSAIAEDKFYEFSSTATLGINLWRDFLGSRFNALKEANELNVKASVVRVDQTTATKLLELTQNYLNYYAAKIISTLGDESLKRANQRFRNTQKRFKDGASPRIDLFQAESSVLNQKEFNYTSKIDQIRAKENLDQLVHKKVQDINFNDQKIKSLKLSTRVKGDLDGNYDLKVLKLALASAKKNLVALKKSDGMDINLTLSYGSNAVDPNKSETFQDGFFSGDRDEKVVSLNVLIPLEDNINGSNTELSKINVLRNQYTYQTQMKNLSIALSNLDQMIDLFREQFLNAKEKVVTNTKSLREANRLYNLGKRDFEFVLNAEDALINAERSLVTIYGNYEKLVATEAFMVGKINTFVSNYGY